MKYIILTILVFLHTTLSADNVTLEEAKRNYSSGNYLKFDSLPPEIKNETLQYLLPEDIGCFGLTNQSNYEFVKKYYPVQLTLGALRYRIKGIFSNHDSFASKEEAIDAAKLFLEFYFPNENAINVFLDMHLTVQGTQEPYKAFLEHVSGCFPYNLNKDYFDMRKQIISTNAEYEFDSFDNFVTAFLPPEIVNLTNLKYLSLNDNHLRFLPNISSLKNLAVLKLSNNQLYGIPEISTLTNLHTLDLSNNQLQTVPDWISTLTNLRHLDLSINQLQTVPDWISNLTNLRHLDLSNNQLQAIPDISTLTNLHTLYLNNNQLKSLPDISTLTHLEYLDLSSNRLQLIPPISTLTNLLFLSLRDNQLHVIPDISTLTHLWILRLKYDI